MDIEVFLAVQVTLDVIAFHPDADIRPAVVVLDVGILERRRPLAVDDLVDPEVVFLMVDGFRVLENMLPFVFLYISGEVFL